MMHPLRLHPECAAGPIRSVEGWITPTQAGCKAGFALTGDISKIAVPEQSGCERTDNLWKTTCLEIFWQAAGNKAYREFNLSPSGRWACYDFDDYRKDGSDGQIGAIALACSANDGSLSLEADIATELALPAYVGLTAVVEDTAGNIQYWSLAFADGKADFHKSACRALYLEKT